jgi:hypothetical protein
VSGLQHRAAVLGHTDSFDGRTFAFIGEPFRGRVDLVELFKDPHFTMTRGTTLSRVPTDEQITAAWEAEPNAPMIGPFDPAVDAGIDPNLVADQTRSICTRVLIWIPPKYLSLVIGKSLTPRQLWMDVASKVIQDGLAEEGCAFLDWIALAGIRHESGAAQSCHASAFGSTFKHASASDRSRRPLAAVAPWSGLASPCACLCT